MHVDKDRKLLPIKSKRRAQGSAGREGHRGRSKAAGAGHGPGGGTWTGFF